MIFKQSDSIKFWTWWEHFRNEKMCWIFLNVNYMTRQYNLQKEVQNKQHNLWLLNYFQIEL